MAENRSGHDNFGQSKYGYENKEAAEYTLFDHATHKHSTFRQFDGRRVDTLVVYAWQIDNKQNKIAFCRRKKNLIHK